jgi:hypothetical protein
MRGHTAVDTFVEDPNRTVPQGGSQVIAIVDVRRRLAEFVTERPARAGVFERLGPDCSYHGRRPLADACVEAGLDPVTVAGAVVGPGDGEVERHQQKGPPTPKAR